MYDPSHNWLKISLDKDTKPYSPNIVMTSSVTLTWPPQKLPSLHLFQLPHSSTALHVEQ